MMNYRNKFKGKPVIDNNNREEQDDLTNENTFDNNDEGANDLAPGT